MYRRSYKLYLMVIPLLLYLGLMYRVLEGPCLDTRSADGRTKQDTHMYTHSEARSRRIMQISRDNSSSLIIELTKEYENLEQHRKHIIRTINRVLEAASDDYQERNDFYNIKGLLNQNDVNVKGNILKFKSNKIREKLPSRALRQGYKINCVNINQVRLINKIGHGVSKQTFKAEYNGDFVAVKMVTRHQSEVRTCIANINDSHPNKEQLRSRCFVFPTMKLMKEILLLEQLNHSGFAQMIGYCIRNEESDTTDLNERGIVSVFELGERFMINNHLQTLTWQQRIQHALDLAEFLDYLENSPLGSLRVRDFKEEHFLMINGSIKMIDLDDVDNLEPVCATYVNVVRQTEFQMYGKSNGCEFNLPCERGMCVGFNAKQNMKFMNKLFFKRLLFPTVFPMAISQKLGTLLSEIDNNQMNASELHRKLTILLGST